MPAQTQMIDRRESSVRNLLAGLFESVDKALGDALLCIRHHDIELAQTIIDSDAEINKLYHRTEQQCVAVIARMQPMARDLRELISDMQIASELERIGDYAANVASNVQQMKTSPPEQIANAVEHLGELCRQMLASVWKAYQDHDRQCARDAAEVDNEVDATEQEIIRQVFDWQSKHPNDFMISTHTLWITHSFERIGDRATNIAERVVYIATSKTEDLN